jgi:hypothetical protein
MRGRVVCRCLFRELPAGGRRRALLMKAVPERAIERSSMSPRALAVKIVIKVAFFSKAIYE